MPNQKSNKGKKNKHANSSGDKQENGALAAVVVAAAGAAAGPIEALGMVAAAGGSGPMAAARGNGSAGRAAAVMGSASADARNREHMMMGPSVTNNTPRDGTAANQDFRLYCIRRQCKPHGVLEQEEDPYQPSDA
uniref:Uncharacterized protein n=1 Tax=Sphaerodactylus townsendi TaxID=933632 RepID=A0ACB8EGT2_9SAUR